MDKFGTRRFVFFLSSCVVLGQFVFALGVSLKMYPIMHTGRFIFGIGGESLAVAV